MSVAVVLFRSVEFRGYKALLLPQQSQQAVDEEEGVGWQFGHSARTVPFRLVRHIYRRRKPIWVPGWDWRETLTRFSGPISHRLWADWLKHKPHYLYEASIRAVKQRKPQVE
jgi:hypothetical protein